MSNIDMAIWYVGLAVFYYSGQSAGKQVEQDRILTVTGDACADYFDNKEVSHVVSRVEGCILRGDRWELG